jgi:hypothetical protein
MTDTPEETTPAVREDGATVLQQRDVTSALELGQALREIAWANKVSLDQIASAFTLALVRDAEGSHRFEITVPTEAEA